jgi:acetoin utilization deacetylase AcuC-like enzyme
MGFCILNNVAITAQYLIRTYHLSRILVVDFDAHHGNGTQEIFYGTDKVLFVSIHQKGIFPFSGEASELGEGEGRGYNINLPVHSQFGDQEYTYLIGRTLQMVVEQYLPQIIIVSAGYDGHQDDTISGLQLTTEWFGAVTSMFKQHAREACDGKLLMILEGGYNPISLGASVMATLEKLVSTKNEKTGVLYSERAFQIIKDHPMQDFWTMGH